MTLLIADIASYQGDLTVTDLVRAGFGGVNIKVSHGFGQKSVHPDAAGWGTRARAAGLVVSTFHYLTGEGAGEAQAEYAYARIAELGLQYSTAHQLDVECAPPPALSSVRGYLTRMSTLLGRSVVLYTGDWWWRARPGWNVADLTPYLWSAPAAGYLTGYPGDTSPHWTAGYGGWPMLSVMQHAVGTLSYPDGTRGTIEVSKSAIRDPAVWQALTGGDPVAWKNVPASDSLLAEVNTLAPGRSKESDGTVGDLAHQESISDHNPDETGNTGGASDTDTINEVHARDITSAGPWPAGWSMEKIVQIVLGRCRSEDETRLRYVIYNKRIWSASTDWVQREYNGASPHDHHAHFSFRYGSGSGASNPENDTSPWGLLAALRAEDDDVLNADDKKWIADTIKANNAAVWAVTGDVNINDYDGTGKPSLQQMVNITRYSSYERHVINDKLNAALTALGSLSTALAKVLANVQADDAETAQIIAQIKQTQAELTALLPAE